MRKPSQFAVRAPEYHTAVTTAKIRQPDTHCKALQGLMPDISERYTKLMARIASSTTANNRAAGSVRLLAVSKRHPLTAIAKLAELGHREFGESYVDEGVEKILACDIPELVWHFIGPIQSNKTKDIAANFDWVQSVDRIKILRRLEAQRPESLPPLNVLLQVNIGNEPQKSGVLPEELGPLAEYAQQCERLRLRGVMVIPPQTDQSQQQLRYFRETQTCFESLAARFDNVDTLSMGMSSDMEHAIAAGSTMVRIGTDLFGPRPD